MTPFMTRFLAGFLPYPSPSARSRALAVTALGLVLSLSACDTGRLLDPSTSTDARADAVAGQDAELAKANLFTQFSDIPIPSGADVNLADTLVLGAEQGWLGRLSLDAGFNMTEMYTFYEREMPRFGWEQITTVRARISTMTYQRGNRVATITLQPTLTRGTTVDFTVAPAKGGGASG